MYCPNKKKSSDPATSKRQEDFLRRLNQRKCREKAAQEVRNDAAGAGAKKG